MADKLRIGLIVGGKSSEHEVSIASAKNVFQALDREKYEIVLLGIDRQGIWHLLDQSRFVKEENATHLVGALSTSSRVVLAGCAGGNGAEVFSLSEKKSLGRIDVAFPVLHGNNGEDGSIQGMFQMISLPYVGAGILGSAVGMDKDVSKRLLREAGIPVPRFMVLDAMEASVFDFAEILRQVGMPCFVKPANTGSSVGIRKAHDEKELKECILEALKFDRKILVEEAIAGREIETAVLGGQPPRASLPGEIIPNSKYEFYTYESKYSDGGVELIAPADLAPAMAKEVQRLALKAFKVLCCEGTARVDMFLTSDGRLLLNELNSMPGMTGVSMYPRAWEASGVGMSQVLDELIQQARARERERSNFLHARTAE